MREGELGPELFGPGIAVNDLLQVCGDLDLPLILIEFHDHIDGISALAMSSGTQLRVDRHHVTVAHVHQRTAEREAVDRTFDRYSAFALEDFHDIKRRP